MKRDSCEDIEAAPCLVLCHPSSPSSLAVHYTLPNVGMEYDRSLFGMKLADCRALAKALETNETLTYLDLSNNALDDDKVGSRGGGSHFAAKRTPSVFAGWSPFVRPSIALMDVVLA